MSRQAKPEGWEPELRFPEGHAHAGALRCVQWIHKYGRQCKALAKLDSGTQKCIKHGGSSLKGIAHPNYKDGKYVRNLPGRYLENYVRAQQNPDYLKLQDDIALVDARLLELTSSIDTDASSQIFAKLVNCADKIDAAREAIVRARTITDKDERQKAQEKANADFLGNISEMERLARTGAKEWYIWNDIMNAIENRRRLVETERKLLVDIGMMIRIDDVLMRFDALMESIRRNVTDRSLRAKVQSDYNRIIGSAGQ